MPSVALVTNVLASYRVPCFRELACHLPNDLAIFTLAHDMTHRRYILADELGDLPVSVLPGLHWHLPPLDDRHLNNVWPVLRSKPDVLILSGWDEPTYLLLWLWGVLFKKKILFWIESTSYDGRRTGVKELAKRTLLKYAAGCLVPGQRARQYCERLGVSPTRIFIAPNATDRNYFQAAANRLRPQRNALRKDFQVENAVVILFVGRLVEAFKGVSILFHAYARLVSENLPVKLIVVGDGPDRPAYEFMIEQLGLPGIDFTGILDHDTLCKYYTAADILVLSSVLETWGFVLNEGMEFGLPLVVSEAVGAGPDLVHEGKNGYSVPVGDIELLAARLVDLVRNRPLRDQMGMYSHRIIERFSPPNWAEGFMQAIRSASARTTP